MGYLQLTALPSIPLDHWFGPVLNAPRPFVLIFSEPSSLILLDQHWPQVPFFFSCQWNLNPSLSCCRADRPIAELYLASNCSLQTIQMSVFLLL